MQLPIKAAIVSAKNTMTICISKLYYTPQSSRCKLPKSWTRFTPISDHGTKIVHVLSMLVFVLTDPTTNLREDMVPFFNLDTLRNQHANEDARDMDYISVNLRVQNCHLQDLFQHLFELLAKLG